MKRIFQHLGSIGEKNLSKGFTLIELLIVIAIIGVLAVGLLVALDPVEQARKATDSNTLRTTSEVKDAITRHYVATTCWPWETLSGTTCSQASGCTNGTGYVLGATGCGATISNALIASGELKSYSSALVNVVPNNGTTTAWKVAFQPTSKNVALNGVAKYTTSTGAGACATLAGAGVDGVCAAAGSSCHYCMSQ